MDREISYDEAEEFLVKHLAGNKTGYRVLDHSRVVAVFLYDVCLKLNRLYPEFNIDSDKMKVVGLLHDIGNYKEKNILHVFDGAELLRKEGFFNIAKIIETHTIAKELAEDFGIEGDFEPRNLEEELLTYADGHVKGDKVVSFEERLCDVIERSKPDPKRYNSLIRAKKRIGKIIDKIDFMLGS